MSTYWDCLPTATEAEEDALSRVSSGSLRRFAGDILTAAGLEPDDADAAASCLVLADLRGVSTHGSFRLLQYADSIGAGDINRQPLVRVVSQTGATAVVDADGGYGYRPSLIGMDVAISLASTMGVGTVAVRNSHHFGMAAAFALRAAERGSIGFVTTNSLPQIAPPGASRAVVGNNPYAFAVPRIARRKPIVIDIALTDAPFGTAALALLGGRTLAPGLALDTHGLPTTDPREAVQSGALVAIGRQKGYALSVASEVLSAALSGSPIGDDSHCHRGPIGGVGHFLMAINPSFFIAPPTFAAIVEALCEQIHGVPPSTPGGEVFVPGELGWRTYARRVRHGIPMPQTLLDALRRLAKRHGVRPLRELKPA
ncbi:MAG: Ldh family oxidoreductase [Candidatus Dormibacteria bacterium]